jgi:hypothetical protein
LTIVGELHFWFCGVDKVSIETQAWRILAPILKVTWFKVFLRESILKPLLLEAYFWERRKCFHSEEELEIYSCCFLLIGTWTKVTFILITMKTRIIHTFQLSKWVYPTLLYSLGQPLQLQHTPNWVTLSLFPAQSYSFPLSIIIQAKWIRIAII